MHQKHPPANVARASPLVAVATFASRAWAPASSQIPPVKRKAEKRVSLSFMSGASDPS